VLPEYDENASSHYFHLYELLGKISKTVDVCLIITTVKSPVKLSGFSKILTPKAKFAPLRLLERFFLFIYARAIGYDKFYVHYSYTNSILTSIVARIFGGKTYVWQCGLQGNYLNEWKFNFSSIKRKILNDIMLMLSYRLATYLVTGTETMANYYSRTFSLPRAKIKVVPNSINASRFSQTNRKDQCRLILNVDKNAKVVLFVHWLSERKGAQYLPEIVEKTVDSVPQAFFVIVGGGPYRPILEKMFSEKKLQLHVKLEGPVPNKMVATYFAESDVFIMPSDEEGFPRVLLECMAMGIPFVATNVGGIRDILTTEQRDFMVKSGRTDDFVAALVKLLKEKSLREKLAAEGFRQVKKYELENVTKLFVKEIIENNESH
jgi:glycosyltransferase involved in cell wall biosynthesis